MLQLVYIDYKKKDVCGDVDFLLDYELCNVIAGL